MSLMFCSRELMSTASMSGFPRAVESVDDQTRQPVVGFEELDQGLVVDQPTQASEPDARCDPDLSDRSVQLRGGDALGVWHFHKPAAPHLERVDHALPRCALDAAPPVVAVDDEVGSQSLEVRDVVERLLRDDLRHALEVLDDCAPLLVGHVGKPLVARDGGVGQQTDRDVPQVRGLLQDVDVSGVDEVSAHPDVHGRSARQVVSFGLGERVGGGHLQRRGGRCARDARAGGLRRRRDAAGSRWPRA
jgi:hypothetical protein